MSTVSSSSEPTTPVKSKSQSKQNPTMTPPKRNLNLLTNKTPEKQPPTPPLFRQAHNYRGVALSINAVRQAASQGCRNHTDRRIKSAKRQILFWPSAEEETGKKDDPVRLKTRKRIKLPEKYEMLVDFFHSFDCSIRLLKLKGSMPTFTNIKSQIECLTDRRFKRMHLAQIKFILPEAIEIRKIRVTDERTECTKSDLCLTVNVDAIDCESKAKTGGNNQFLRQVFRRRLLDFHKSHPQNDEVPEEMLPWPFNHLQKNLQTNISSTPREPIVAETSTAANANLQPAAASHLPQSFRRCFSKAVTDNEAEKTAVVPSTASPKASSPLVPQSYVDKIYSNVEPVFGAALSPIKFASTLTGSGKGLASSVSQNDLPSTPVKEIHKIKDRDESPSKVDIIPSTPAKLASTPSWLMSATPVLHPPKGCFMSPDEDSIHSPKLVRRPPSARSLQFDSQLKNDKSVDGLIEISLDNGSDGDDIDDILSKDLLQSIREKEGKRHKEKEAKAWEEQGSAISQAKFRQLMIAALPKLSNMILFLFQLLNRSVITKEELMHKLIASHLDIFDRREVEEQLRLLLELVPDWISEKLASNGLLLICVNKRTSAESIHIRLAEAK